MQLKRLWDITNKKMVFVKGPTGHECQLWVDEATDKMYYYDMAQWIEYTQSAVNDGRTYGPTWEVVDGDDEMGVYDTNEATELFNWESGDEVSYVFKDWDGTVLKEGKVKEGTKPTAPADPTREATAQYTYTFAGWNPAVAKITKKTVYTATYTATVNQYTITFVDEDGTTVLDEQTLDYGATPVYAGETPTKEATAQYTYTFSGWTPEIATVTGDATYTATYEATLRDYTVTFAVDPVGGGTTSTNEVTVGYGTEISAEDDILYIGELGISATAETGYSFDSWTDDNGDPLPGTVTGALSVVAKFTSSGTPVESITIPEGASLNLSVGYFHTESFECSPSTADDTSNVTVSFSTADIVQNTNTWASNGYIYFEFNPIDEGTTTAEVFVGGTSQGTILITVTPAIHVESISQGVTTATVVVGENGTYSIPISPSTVTNCGSDITIETDDNNIAYFSGWQDNTAGVFYFYGASEGNTQLHYYLNSAPGTVYDIDVTVTVAP